MTFQREKSKRGRVKTPAGDPFPQFIAPCLATLTRAAPDGAQWIHEIKFDGYRIQAHIEDSDVRLYTRKGLDWTSRFTSIAKALRGLKLRTAILDGEVVVEDEHGTSSFVMLVDDLKAGRSARMTYCAFDLLYLNGHDTRALPLLQRKELLAGVLAKTGKTSCLRYSQHIEREGAAMLAEVCKLGLEGIISKRIDKPYRSGRGEDWLKSKCLQSDEFVIGGYVESSAIKNAIGALLLGYFDGTAFRYAGRVGTGFSHKLAHDLWAQLHKLRTPGSPFANGLTALQRKGVVWVKPQLVAQIEYRAITSDNLLRHASFKALREDKPAHEVTLPAFVKRYSTR